MRDTSLRQFRTPQRRARGGKIRNWMNIPTMPYRTKRRPMRSESMPKPPVNLRGRWTLGLEERSVWRG